jgi:salicylate hydroxylase
LKHADVHRLLHDLAVSAGAEITFGATVSAVTPGEPKPSITLATGEVHEADIVIGADGPNSFVREIVLGDDNEAGNISGYSCFGAIIPGEELKKDPELAPWLTADEVRIC